MTIDFHVHSTASDGTLSPAELAERTQGFAAIALTDHDNVDGLSAWPGVKGVELSIEAGKGFDRFHLLGLGIDPENEGLRNFLDDGLKHRNERNERIFANFRRLGIEITDIASYANGKVLARPHIARWLMDHGYATSVADAFEKYLLPESPASSRCYEERWHPAQADAFKAVHDAGGICVMAHPKYWRSGWKNSGCDYEAAERELGRLREMGLDGLEAFYGANTAEENATFTAIADRVGLLKSAGSDFHGENKPEIALGMEVADDFAMPLLDRLGVN